MWDWCFIWVYPQHLNYCQNFLDKLTFKQAILYVVFSITSFVCTVCTIWTDACSRELLLNNSSFLLMHVLNYIICCPVVRSYKFCSLTSRSLVWSKIIYDHVPFCTQLLWSKPFCTYCFQSPLFCAVVESKLRLVSVSYYYKISCTWQYFFCFFINDMNARRTWSIEAFRNIVQSYYCLLSCQVI